MKSRIAWYQLWLALALPLEGIAEFAALAGRGLAEVVPSGTSDVCVDTCNVIEEDAVTCVHDYRVLPGQHLQLMQLRRGRSRSRGGMHRSHRSGRSAHRSSRSQQHKRAAGRKHRISKQDRKMGKAWKKRMTHKEHSSSGGRDTHHGRHVTKRDDDERTMSKGQKVKKKKARDNKDKRNGKKAGKKKPKKGNKKGKKEKGDKKKKKKKDKKKNLRKTHHKHNHTGNLTDADDEDADFVVDESETKLLRLKGLDTMTLFQMQLNGSITKEEYKRAKEGDFGEEEEEEEEDEEEEYEEEEEEEEEDDDGGDWMAVVQGMIDEDNAKKKGGADKVDSDSADKSSSKKDNTKKKANNNEGDDDEDAEQEEEDEDDGEPKSRDDVFAMIEAMNAEAKGKTKEEQVAAAMAENDEESKKEAKTTAKTNAKAADKKDAKAAAKKDGKDDKKAEAKKVEVHHPKSKAELFAIMEEEMKSEKDEKAKLDEIDKEAATRSAGPVKGATEQQPQTKASLDAKVPAVTSQDDHTEGQMAPAQAVASTLESAAATGSKSTSGDSGIVAKEQVDEATIEADADSTEEGEEADEEEEDAEESDDEAEQQDGEEEEEGDDDEEDEEEEDEEDGDSSDEEEDAEDEEEDEEDEEEDEQEEEEDEEDEEDEVEDDEEEESDAKPDMSSSEGRASMMAKLRAQMAGDSFIKKKNANTKPEPVKASGKAEPAKASGLAQTQAGAAKAQAPAEHSEAAKNKVLLGSGPAAVNDKEALPPVKAETPTAPAASMSTADTKGAHAPAVPALPKKPVAKKVSGKATSLLAMLEKKAAEKDRAASDSEAE